MQTVEWDNPKYSSVTEIITFGLVAKQWLPVYRSIYDDPITKQIYVVSVS